MNINEFIEKNPDWYEEKGKLVAGFEFTDFSAVETIVKGIMELANEQNHHPEVSFGFNTVEVKTVTHDAADSITEKDFALASAISALVTGK